MHGDPALSAIADIESDEVELLDGVIADRRAANAQFLAVNVDVAARIFGITEQPVRGIRIIETHGKMEEAFRIEALDFVKTLRRLAITLASLWTGATGAGENRVEAHQTKRLASCAGPELDRGLRFKPAKKNLARRICDPRPPKSFLYDLVPSRARPCNAFFAGKLLKIVVGHRLVRMKLPRKKNRGSRNEKCEHLAHAAESSLSARHAAIKIARMKYRRFGRTDLQMPVFSCGGMRYQHKWDDVPPREVPEDGQRNLEATILRALELGINHIETARGYGSSEMQLGWVLPKLPREKMIVQTKVSPFATAREFRETFATSMRYLKLDYVDLLSLHGINNAELLDWSLRSGGCLDAARQLQREGRCRHIGFTTHSTTDIMVQAIESDAFDYVNLHWYFVNEFNWPAVEAATARDMGVFIISPTDKGGMLYSPPAKLTELCAPLSPIAFNDLYCLARPEVHTLSIGAARPSDFDEHVAALAHYDRAGEVIAPIEQRLRAEMERALGADWWRELWRAFPNYVDVPGEVNVQEILRLWSFAKSLDLVEWGKMRYNLMGNAGHWFPGVNAAALDPAKIRATLSNSPFGEKAVDVLAEAHAMLHGEQQKRLSESD
jgi:predicted aldo/keto reductase-like oxidoreductase